MRGTYEAAEAVGSVMPRGVQASWLPISLQHGKGMDIDVLELWEEYCGKDVLVSIPRKSREGCCEHVEDVQRKGRGKSHRDRASCYVCTYLPAYVPNIHIGST